MKFEMATLYSRFAACRAEVAFTFPMARTEWGRRIKAMFCDVLGHFYRGTVAKRRQWMAGPVVVAVALVSGCASLGGLGPDTPTEVKRDAVAARAQARWERLINRDLEGAYAYMSPASRATTPLDLYKAKHKVGMYRSAKVDDVKCEAVACTVTLSLTYEHARMGKGRKGVTITTPLTENWIITEGQAWFVERS
jgi:hypothetical protein